MTKTDTKKENIYSSVMFFRETEFTILNVSTKKTLYPNNFTGWVVLSWKKRIIQAYYLFARDAIESTTNQVTWTMAFISQLWRREVQNQGVSRAILPLKPVGVNPSLPLPRIWWSASNPKCSSVCSCSTSISTSISHIILPLQASVSSYNDISYTGLRFTLIMTSFQHYISNNSKKSHFEVKGLRASMYALGEHNQNYSKLFQKTRGGWNTSQFFFRPELS